MNFRVFSLILWLKDGDGYRVLLLYMISYIIVKSTKFLKFPKTSYIIVKKIAASGGIFYIILILFRWFNDLRNVLERFSLPQARFLLVWMQNNAIFYWEIGVFNCEIPKFSPAAHYFSIIYNSKKNKIFEKFQNIIYNRYHI